MNIDNNTLKEWAVQWPKGPLTKAAYDICAADPDVIVLAADLAKALGVDSAEAFEGQYYNVGIAEQNMMGIACGLALEGKTPVATSFTPFLTLRACEQIRSSVCYMNLNVKLIGSNAGVRGGKAGTSHYGLEDISVLRSFPNMVVLSPSDGLSLYKRILAMMEHKGPAYVRVAGVPEMRVIYDKDYDFVIGKAIRLVEGADVAILATGPMVAKAQDAMEILKDKGISPTLYDFQTIKPLDTEVVREVSSTHKLVVTIEENTIIGGFGGAVAEEMAQNGGGAKLKILGLQDKFMKIGSYEAQLRKCGIMPDQIAATIEEALA